MTYRLYVGHDLDDRTKFCKGSVLCMNVIDKNPALEKMIRIENLNTILANGTPVPAWLHGTPTLVDVERKKIYYGLSARDTLLDIQPPVPESTRNFQKPPGIPSLIRIRILLRFKRLFLLMRVIQLQFVRILTMTLTGTQVRKRSKKRAVKSLIQKILKSS